MQKMCFIDIESTGTDPKRHGITQVAGLVCHYDRSQGFSEGREFNFLVRPFPNDVVEAKALEVQARTAEEIKTFSPPHEVWLALKGIWKSEVDPYNRADKMFFVGYNAQFDMNFLREFWVKCGDQYFGSWFFFPPIDVMLYAAVDTLEQRSEMKDYKLGTLLAHYGINGTEGQLHDALFDIRQTMRLFKHLLSKKGT